MQEKPTLESNVIFRETAPKSHMVVLQDAHQRLIDRFSSREGGNREDAKEYIMPN